LLPAPEYTYDGVVPELPAAAADDQHQRAAAPVLIEGETVTTLVILKDDAAPLFVPKDDGEVSTCNLFFSFIV